MLALGLIEITIFVERFTDEGIPLGCISHYSTQQTHHKLNFYLFGPVCSILGMMAIMPTFPSWADVEAKRFRRSGDPVIARDRLIGKLKVYHRGRKGESGQIWDKPTPNWDAGTSKIGLR